MAAHSYPARQNRPPRTAVLKRGLRAPKRSRSLAVEERDLAVEVLFHSYELELAYARVSTSSGEQLDALRSQIHRLKGLTPVPQHVFVEVQSGLDTDRAQYEILKQLIEERRVKRVRVAHASRLGRDLPEAVSFIALADENGCTIESLKEGVLSFKDSASTIQTVLWAAFAQNESRELSTRIVNGYAEGRMMGKPMRKPPWGYVLSSDKTKLEPHPVEFAAAQRFIARLRDCGWQVMKAWREDEEVPFKTIRGVTAWLDNPTLRGGLEYNKHVKGRDVITLWDQHPRLLSDEDYGAWQQRRMRNRKLWGHNAECQVRPLTGLLRCTECLYKHKYISGRTIASLRCNGDGCSQHYRGVREQDIVEWVIGQVREQAAARLAQTVEWKPPPEAEALQQEIQKYEKLQDPDLEQALALKRQRLEGMMRMPSVDTRLLNNLVQERWWSNASYEKLVAILQRVVVEVQITNQEPSGIVLRL